MLDGPIYLDYNATHPVKESVLCVMMEHISLPYNASSVHYYGRKARGVIEKAKVHVFAACHASPEAYDIIFTSSGTEAHNMVLNGFGEHKKLVSSTEHVSVLAPATSMQTTQIIPVKETGIIDIEALEHHLAENYKTSIFSLISVMWANNETGVIQPVDAISALAKRYNALFHTDAVQAFGKTPINLTKTPCDIITLSAHKIGGPQGIGAVLFKKHLTIEPFIKGGKQQSGFRAGTEPIALIAGMGEACRSLHELLDIQPDLAKKRNRMESILLDLAPETCILGHTQERLSNTSCIIMEKVDQATQLMHMDMHQIAVSSGSACSSGKVTASHVLKAMGFPEEKARSALRISMGLDTKDQELEKFITVWKALYLRTRSKISEEKTETSYINTPLFSISENKKTLLNYYAV